MSLAFADFSPLAENNLNTTSHSDEMLHFLDLLKVSLPCKFKPTKDYPEIPIQLP